MDYTDFKAVLKLKNKGLHLTKEGLRVINLLSQNNNRRLSNASGFVPVDRSLLYVDIEKLLEGGKSNYEYKEDGRVFIKSLNKYQTGGKRSALIIKLLDPNGFILYLILDLNLRNF